MNKIYIHEKLVTQLMHDLFAIGVNLMTIQRIINTQKQYHRVNAGLTDDELKLKCLRSIVKDLQLELRLRTRTPMMQRIIEKKAYISFGVKQ